MDTRKVNVAFVIKELVPYRVKYFHLIAKELKGDSLFLIDKTSSQETEELLNVYPFETRLIKNNFKLPSLLFKQNRFPRYIPFGIIGIIKKFNPDIIVCPEYSLQTLFSLIYCKIKNKKVIIWCSLTDLDERISFMGQPYYRAILRKYADAFICYSVHAKKYLIKNKVNPNNCFVAENCTDVDYFRGRYDREKDPRPNKKIKLLYVGALVEEKGIHFMLNCLEKLINYEWTLTLIGKGNLMEEIQNSWMKRLPNRINLLGGVKRENLPSYYLESDLFIFPTTSDVWGHVIDEAMALGCAVLSSDHCIAAKELINSGENGMIYKLNNEEDFIQKFRCLVTNREYVTKLGRNARTTMDNHNEKISKNGFLAAIDYVTKS